MTPEEEKKKQLETLEECRRMIDGWDNEMLQGNHWRNIHLFLKIGI